MFSAIQLHYLLFGVFQTLDIFLEVGPVIVVFIDGDQSTLMRFTSETQSHHDPREVTSA